MKNGLLKNKVNKMEVVCESLEMHGYKYIQTIGKGGYALCMKVENKRYQDTEFACKMICINDMPKAEKSYCAEIDALISINDPGIVKIYDHFIEGKQYFIILELCPNGSLDTIMKNKIVLGNSILTTYAKSLLKALACLHDNHIAHHDIKPANFFVDTYGRAKIGDFGIAKKYEPGQLSTKYEGSLPYMAPEIIHMKSYDPFKSDVWAFGVSLYELGMLELPFKGTTKQEVKESILSGIYQPPKNLSSPLRTIIQSCLKEDPLERPTAAQLFKMLQPLISQPTHVIRPVRVGRQKMANTHRTTAISSLKARTVGCLPKLHISSFISKEYVQLSS